MSNQNDTTLKRCTKCNDEYPATTEYFNADCTRRDRLHPYCRSCRAAQKTAWRQSNPEKAKAQSLAWRKNNPEKVKASRGTFYKNNREKVNAESAEWQRNNKDKVNARVAAWSKKNPDKVKIWKAAWKKSHPDKVNAHAAAYRKKHPEKGKAAKARRRALKLKAFGSYTTQDLVNQAKRQKDKCYWCGTELGKNPHTDYHPDHVDPLSRSLNNHPSNIVAACPKCNMSKGAKRPIDWAGNGGKMF